MVAMVMELMDTSLYGFIKRNTSIPLYSALSILHDVSLGVWYIHGCDPPIMHCDITPNSVLLCNADGLLVAKVSGFEYAIEGSKGDTRPPGTLHFMPPEALVMDPVYALPLDVFSYGRVALCAVVGKWPAPSD